jgi:hypothetical protein
LEKAHGTQKRTISQPTLQGWEQGPKQLSGAARMLLTIARKNPMALLAAAAEKSARAEWPLNL